jgi:hypothetical protein
MLGLGDKAKREGEATQASKEQEVAKVQRAMSLESLRTKDFEVQTPSMWATQPAKVARSTRSPRSNASVPSSAVSGMAGTEAEEQGRVKTYQQWLQELDVTKQLGGVSHEKKLRFVRDCRDRLKRDGQELQASFGESVLL